MLETSLQRKLVVCCINIRIFSSHGRTVITKHRTGFGSVYFYYIASISLHKLGMFAKPQDWLSTLVLLPKHRDRCVAANA